MIASINRKLLCFVALTLSLMGAVPAHAQYTSDIDIYSAPVGSGPVPNVLFILDNSANWNAAISIPDCFYKDGGVTTTSGPEQGKKYSIEFCALYNVIDSLPIGANDTALFNIGFMFFNNTTVGTGARAIRAFTALNMAGKTALKTLIKGMGLNPGAVQSGAPTSYAPAMHEAFLYYTRAQPLYGKLAGTPTFDANAFSGSNYTLPVGSDCGKNYIILLANGPPQSDQISNDTMEAKLAVLAGNTPQKITYGTEIDTKDADNWTDEYARFMSSQNIITYTIAVTGSTSDKVTYPNIFKAIGKQGGGGFYDAKSIDDLALTFREIFNQVQAVLSVFASSSLPVSVNARGTYLNQIFMGMFQPDVGAQPRWRGNLKQYKFGYDPTTDSLFLSDANNNPAISGATGFISPSAVSFWTSPSAFWANQQLGTPLSSSDSPDGEVVEKGGVAQQIRSVYATSQTSRNVYTCIGCVANTNLATTASAKFDTSIANNTSLGLSSNTNRANLINWVRGTDNADDEKGPGGTVTVRPSVHGDVLHSRPAVVNYGGDTGVVVFYGSNDGMLRAVNGKQTGPGAGNELWSFIPEEHFPMLNRLRANSPEIRLSTTISSTATPRAYFVDGPIGIYQKVSSTGVNEKVILYVAMRRGGRILYALDVTNPSAPTFLWKKTQTDIPVLGQTWSEPKVAKIRGNTNPVIIMGAGYDTAAEDISPQGTTTMGNAVLVLDAFTGARLKQFNTDRSVPADVSLLDTDFDGFVDRGYAVDVGGNIYRIDLEQSTGFAVTDWDMFKLAALTGSGTRKFFYPPDVVVTPQYTAVLAGSGDREKPLATTSSDAFFTVYDRNLAKGTPASPTTINASNLGAVGTTEDQTAGCYLSMSTSGEKIVNAPLTVGGITYFGTNQPAPSTISCSANLGIAKVYSAPLFCKVATTQTLTGGGLPPSAVSGTVTVSYNVTTGGVNTTVTKLVPFIIGVPNSKGSGIEGSKVTPTINPVRKRSYWYLENAR